MPVVSPERLMGKRIGLEHVSGRRFLPGSQRGGAALPRTKSSPGGLGKTTIGRSERFLCIYTNRGQQ